MNVFYITQPITWMYTPVQGPTYLLPVATPQNLESFAAQAFHTSIPNSGAFHPQVASKMGEGSNRSDFPGNRLKLGQKDQSLRKPLRLQNTSRNTFTNLGNQVITYASVSKKSRLALSKLYPSLTDDEINNYYQYATQLRKTINGYINLVKLKKLWGARPEASLALYQLIFIKLSTYYLSQISIPALLTSRKLKKQVLSEHLSTRRVLLKVIKNIQ